MKSRQPELDSSSIVETALKKILDFLGLRCIKTRFSRSIPYVAEFTGAYGTVRQFKTVDRPASLMTIYFSSYEDCSPFPCFGTWDIFKDDDNATLDLFTKTVKKFDLYYCDSFGAKHDISNPFFGCRSPEEVIVKYDLLTT